MRSYFLWLVNFSLPEDELPVLTFLFAYVRSYLNYVFVNRIEKSILGRVQKSIRKCCCTRIAGEALDEVVDALVSEDQARRLAEGV